MDESRYSFNSGVIREFGVADYVLFALTLVISGGIGIFYAILDRKRVTTKDFLLGGKGMSVFPVAMSLMVTFMSALTLLGNPAEIYNYNTMFFWIAVSFVFAIAGAAYLFIPFFYRLQVFSTFEYLEMRFDKYVKMLGSSLLILQTLLYMAFLLYAPSLAINAVTGVNLWGCAVGMGVVVTLYTSLGGMKAVLWTDTFQAAVIFSGLLAVLIQGSIVEGGFAKAWEIANNRSRVLLDDFSFDPKTRHSVWSIVVGGTVFWCYLYGVNQAQVQRCLSCPTIRKAQIAMAINLPGLMMIVTLSNMIGVIMFAFYADCHPISYNKIVATTDQLLPLYVMDILGHLPGLPGIFVSCIVSGSLSSLSSGMNALSAVVFRDFLHHTRCFANMSEFRATIVSKLLVVVFGVLSICLAWVVSQLGNILQAVYVVFGILNGPVMGVMTLGMFFPWANRRGALVGILASLTLMLWIGMGAYANNVGTPKTPTVTTSCNWTARPPAPTTTMATSANLTTLATDTGSSAGALEPLYRMSYMWYTGLGILLVWFFGMIVSLLTGLNKPTSLDPKLIMPIFDKLFPYLPEKILKPLRFGIVHEGKYDETPAPTSMELDAEKGSKPSAVNEKTVEAVEKQGHSVTNGKVKPTSETNGVTTRDVQLDLQGQDNKGYEADGKEGNDTINTRL